MDEKKLETEPQIMDLFDAIVESQTAGNPMQAEIRWTHLKTSDLVKSLAEKGVEASRFIVKQVAKAKGLVKRKMSKVLTIKEVANAHKHDIQTFANTIMDGILT